MPDKPTLPIDEMMPEADVTRKEVDPRPLYWQRLSEIASSEVAKATGARITPDGGLSLEFLGGNITCVPKERRTTDSHGDPIEDFLSELVILLYLVGKDADPGSRESSPPPGKAVSPLQLPTGSTFFRGPHVIPTAPLAEGFGDDPEGFLRAGESLGGSAWKQGDASFKLMVLPYVEMHFILYVADDEFPANVNILVSETIDRYLSLDGVWGLSNIVVKRLLKEKFG
ncbi:MAG: DUF3786 domain-containing protein [Deltaproteobacteria bacterium]|nr:DUF3786 domain-containing protein [Deltaproteobacteria bacterium]